MSTRDSFVARFDEANAAAIEAAAEGHKNGIHDDPGSDPFRWAIALAIGYQCAELDGYREHHGITTPWSEIRDWIKTDGDLANHDGDCDYLAVFTGTHNEYVGLPPVGVAE
jgi:hypothetical protein